MTLRIIVAAAARLDAMRMGRRVVTIMAYELQEGDEIIVDSRGNTAKLINVEYDRQDFEVYVQWKWDDEVDSKGEFCDPGKQFKVVWPQ